MTDELSPPEGFLTVGELIIALVEFGEMGAPVILLGEGWLTRVEDDLGRVVMLHALPEDGGDEPNA